MEMCYRGVKYNYSPVVLDLKIKEREIGYSVAQTRTIQTKFLGRVCQKETIALTVADKKTRFLGRVCHTNLVSQTTANVAS